MPTSLSTPQTLPLGYTAAATLGPIQNLEKIVWQNTGGVVVFQVGRLDATGKVVFDQTEAVLPPGIWGMDNIYGIRFRSRDAAALATLDPCTGYFEDDPDPFNPGTVPGSTAAITGAVNVQHNGALVGSQPTLDFIDSADGSFAWTVNNDGPNTRVTITEPNSVVTFNTRTGAVVPTTGDYTAAQVTNAADKSSASAQIFVGPISTGPTAVNLFNINGSIFGAGDSFLSTIRSSSSVGAWGTAVNGDTQYRYIVTSAGQLQWGTGAAAADITLSRVVLNTVTSLQVTAGQGISNGGTPNNLTTTGWVVWSSVMTMIGSAAGNNTYLGGIQNEATYRWRITTDGIISIGGGAVATDVTMTRVVNGATGTGSFWEMTAGSGLGYGTGVGGIATIATGSSGTINKPTGKVTASAAVATGGAGSYTVTNSVVGIDDVVIVNIVIGGGNQQRVFAKVQAGSFTIDYENNSGVNQTPVFTFAVIKGAVS